MYVEIYLFRIIYSIAQDCTAQHVDNNVRIYFNTNMFGLLELSYVNIIFKIMRTRHVTLDIFFDRLISR